jgi:membrane protein YqaA with SNARE-associated domain
MSNMTMLYQAGKRAARSSVKSSHLLRWLISLGGVGLFAVSIVDSSVIPLPLPGSTDLLLLLLSAHRGATAVTAVTLASSAFIGSMLGGYLTWGVGKKGGEKALERYVPKRILGHVTSWVEKRGAWSVAVAAILPPPIPLTPFTLAAGALGVPRNHFLVGFGVARLVRYGSLAWIGVTYGRRVVRLWQQEQNGWSTTILWVYGALVLLGILYGIWKYRKSRNASAPNLAPSEQSS